MEVNGRVFEFWVSQTADIEDSIPQLSRNLGCSVTYRHSLNTTFVIKHQCAYTFLQGIIECDLTPNVTW